MMGAMPNPAWVWISVAGSSGQMRLASCWWSLRLVAFAHEVTGFRDWSVSGLVRYDPNPSSARGVSASLRSSIATASIDGVDALLGRDSLTIPEVHGGSPRRQLVAEAAYGFAILGGHLTGAPWAGIGLLESGRDYRVGLSD